MFEFSLPQNWKPQNVFTSRLITFPLSLSLSSLSLYLSNLDVYHHIATTVDSSRHHHCRLHTRPPPLPPITFLIWVTLDFYFNFHLLLSKSIDLQSITTQIDFKTRISKVCRISTPDFVFD